MDEMRINLSSKLMKGTVTKLIAMMLRKKTGCEIDIVINNASIQADNGKVIVHMNADAEMTTENFTKLIKKIGLERA